jgi:transposase
MKAPSIKKFNLKTPHKAKVDLSNLRKLPNLTESQREMIHLLHNDGKKPSEIAAKIGCNKSTVTRTLKKIKETNSYSEKNRSGRPPKVTERTEKKIITISSNNRRLVSSQIRDTVNEKNGRNSSDRMVRNVLCINGFKGRPAAKKPLLSSKNIKKRLQLAKHRQNWTIDQSKKVLWTDESGFQVFGTNRRQIVRRFDHEDLKEDTIHQTVKGRGGGVMVWGCFAENQTGNLHGIMVSQAYHGILQHEMVPSRLGLITDSELLKLCK